MALEDILLTMADNENLIIELASGSLNEPDDILSVAAIILETPKIIAGNNGTSGLSSREFSYVFVN